MEVQKVAVELEVPKESYELAMGLMKFGLVCFDQLKDGADFSDVAPIVQSAQVDLAPALIGVSQVVDEFKENKVAFGIPFILAAVEMIEKIAQMKEQQAQG